MPKKTADSGEPKFPYTTEPKALRRLLTEIPKRPKPPKVTLDTLKAWNVSSNNNARTAINVLKRIGFLGPSGDPMAAYIEFMKKDSGATVLAERVKDVYRVLFDNSFAPQNDTDEDLRNLFNIHSGGGEDAMRLQVQTFKALCEYANFSTAAGTPTKPDLGRLGAAQATGNSPPGLPPVQVDLHIHLPENKTTRDYEAIIQDIARYIYGRNIDKT